jgi:hypothetical protein
MSLFLWVLIRQNSYSLTTLTGLPFSTKNWLHVHCISFNSACFSEIQIDTRDQDSNLLLSSCSTPYRIPLPAARLTHHPHKNPFSIAITCILQTKEKEKNVTNPIKKLLSAFWSSLMAPCYCRPLQLSIYFSTATKGKTLSRWMFCADLQAIILQLSMAFNGILPF